MKGQFLCPKRMSGDPTLLGEVCIAYSKSDAGLAVVRKFLAVLLFQLFGELRRAQIATVG